MDRYLLPEINVANIGANIQSWCEIPARWPGIDKIASESKERKLVAKDYIAHLIDAQPPRRLGAVITTAKDYQLEARLLPEGKKIEGGQASHRHLGRLQDRRLGLGTSTVWMPLRHWMASRLGSRQEQKKEPEGYMKRRRG